MGLLEVYRTRRKEGDPNKLAATWWVSFDDGCTLGDSRAAYKAKGEA